MKSIRISHLIVLSLLLAALSVTAAPVLSQGLAPRITITPVWRPGTTLDTLLAPTPEDPIKYVEAQIFVTTTVPFWAMEMTCSVNNLALNPYDYDQVPGGTPETPSDPGDDIAPIRMGTDWGGFLFDYVSVPTTDQFDPNTDTAQFNAFTVVSANLNLRLTATRLANPNFSIPPMGELGVETNFLLATIRYRVDTITPATLTSPFACTNIAFLDRNGRPVVTPVYTAPQPLTIIKGYTVSGKGFYQARTNHTGIQVGCDGPDLGTGFDFTATTNAAGVFTQTNVRSLGRFDCLIFGNISGPGQGPDLHLQAARSFDLVMSSYTLQPVTLKTGNVDPDLVFPEDIDTDDLAVITGNPLGAVVTPNTNGDANGDGRRDRSDLALVAGNLDFVENVDGSAVLYNVARTFPTNQTIPDYRIHLGDSLAGGVTQLVTGNFRDFWPATSPDGSRIAFVRSVGGPLDNLPATNPPPAFALFTIPSTGVGAPTRLTPASLGASFSAFAPSWSQDGQRIAFICANDETYITANEASLCVVDANGRNFRRLLQGTIDIYPPAWLNADAIVVSSNGILGTFDLTIDFFFVTDSDIPSGGNFEDQPAIQDGLLFYRSGAVGTDFGEIRVASVDPTDVFDPVDAAFAVRQGYSVAAGAPFHTEVAEDFGGIFFSITVVAQYYEVSETGYNIMYYEIGGSDFFLNSYFTLDPVDNVPNYTDPFAVTHFVDGQLSNSPNLFLHAVRSTIDWVP